MLDGRAVAAILLCMVLEALLLLRLAHGRHGSQRALSLGCTFISGTCVMAALWQAQRGAGALTLACLLLAALVAHAVDVWLRIAKQGR